MESFGVFATLRRMKRWIAQANAVLTSRPDFNRLWYSDTISLFGSQISLVALPLSAALLLNARPAQMGVLVALETLPSLLFALHAGALVDRARKLTVIKLGAFGRGALLLLIPLAAFLGELRMEVIYTVAFLTATLAVFTDVAYQALVPTLVGRDELVSANARLAVSESSADIVGPGLAGVLVQWISAPLAVALDALALFLSGWLLSTVSVAAPPARTGKSTTLVEEIKQGIRAVWGHSTLRWVACLLAGWQMLHHMLLALFLLFAVREAGLSAAMVGVAFSFGGLGFLAASLGVDRLSRGIGLGPTMLAGMCVAAFGWEMISWAPGNSQRAMVHLSLASACENCGAGLFFLSYVSLRQGLTPAALLGRVIATTRFVTVAAAPAGALAGGILGGAIGLRESIMMIGLGGIGLAAFATLCSPLRALTSMPEAIVGADCT
jgi:hypothetical protein